MKIATAGKGGVGKTSISGTLARLLARSGRRVLAIDADSNPNLGLTLGIEAARFHTLPTLPRDLLGPNGVGLVKPLDEIVAGYAVRASDAVTLLVMVNPQKAGTG